MNFFQWVIINIPETFVFVVFLRYALRQKLNILLSVIIVAIGLSIVKAYIDTSPFIGTISMIILYLSITIHNSKPIAIIKNLGVINFIGIGVDSLWMLFVYIISGKTIDYIQSNYYLFLVSVTYAAITKALLLYFYYNQRRFKL